MRFTYGLILLFFVSTAFADDLVINKPVIPRATQAQAEAGTENTVVMTPLRTKQSIATLGVVGPSSSTDSTLVLYDGISGRIIKSIGAITGVVKVIGGVPSIASAGTDYQGVLVNSAGLITALSDETGTGLSVFSVSPLVQTPTITDGAIFNLLSNNNITIDASTNPRTITTGVVRINHTAGMVGTRPFALNIDAAGFGDTHAVSTDFTATGIGAGEQNHLFDINVNTANSTGGEVNGFVMAKSGTGSIDCNAVEVYPGVDVISQRTGVETAIEQAFSYNGAYADITSNLSSAASDVQLFVANGDIVYIGNATTFNSLAVTLAVAASGAGIKPTFEYSAGASSWTTFSPTDGTNGFRNLGGTIAWGTLAGWATDTVNAVGSKYWIRITRTQNTLATPPTEDLIKYIASVNYGWDKDGDISAATLNGLTCTAQTNGFTIAGGTTSKTLTVPLDASVSGTNTGDNATNSQYSSLVSNATHTGDATGSTALTVVGVNGTLMSGLATGIVKNTTTTGVPSIAVAGDFPTLNQNTTGNAATVTTNANLTGHVTSTGNAAVLGTFTSADLAGALSDETGTGAAVFGTSPTFTTQITTPSIISAGALGITPASGSNLNVSLAGTGDFAVNTNQLYVDTSSGYVGIGMSTPGVALDVIGIIKASNRIQSSGVNNLLRLTYPSVADFDFSVSSDGRLGIIGGNVGIGTAGPQGTLDVRGIQGTIGTAINQPGVLSVIDESANAIGAGAMVTLGGRWSGAATTYFAGIKGINELGTNGGVLGALGLYSTDNVNGYLAERMRINSSGNVGIGTTTASNIITCPIASDTDPIADAWTVHCLGDYKDIDTGIDAVFLGNTALEKVKLSKVSKFTKHASVDREAVEKSLKTIYKNTIKDKAKKDLDDYTLATGVKIESEDYINETLDGLWETKEGKEATVDAKKIEEEAVKKLLPKFSRINYGLVAEDAPPEAQVHDINGNLQGVDPYALIGILWAAVQSQERRLILLEGR